MIGTRNKRDKKAGNAQKFLFDQNCFDEDYEEEVIEEPPPPPVYSEAELEAARKEGYESGKKDGLAEAAASREKQVAGILDTISREFRTLFEAETLRNSQHESEAVALARAIFLKLFPVLNERYGLTEIEDIIRRVLNSQKEQPEIVIEVRNEYRDEIAQRLQTQDDPITEGKITVKGRDEFGHGDCRMSWHNGGGGRDAGYLAEEIRRQIEHMLADRPTLRDNEGADAEMTIMENSDE